MGQGVEEDVPDEGANCEGLHEGDEGGVGGVGDEEFEPDEEDGDEEDGDHGYYEGGDVGSLVGGVGGDVGGDERAEGCGLEEVGVGGVDLGDGGFEEGVDFV